MDNVDPDLPLFHRARTGDFDAFDELVGRWQSRVYGLAYRMLGESHDAEDISQQTFLSVIEHLESFRGESTVIAWVLRIAANHALKLLRKKRGLPIEKQGIEDTEPGYDQIPHPQLIAPWLNDPADLASRHEIRELIDAALLELDDKLRSVFVLRDIEGFNVKETAQLLGLTEANVKVRLLRARLALREKLTTTLGDETARVIHTHEHESHAGRSS
jgi:RNA polymerase sigma-70 factor (ECF subfamily)